MKAYLADELEHIRRNLLEVQGRLQINRTPVGHFVGDGC